MSSNLNPRQGRLLAYIRRHIARKGYAPSAREMGRALGINSMRLIEGDLERLEEAGAIGRDRRVARAIWLPESADEATDHLQAVVAAWQALPRDARRPGAMDRVIREAQEYLDGRYQAGATA